MLESAEENQCSFERAKEQPYSLDDYLVGRADRVYAKQLNDLWIHEGQLFRWATTALTSPQRQEVVRLAGQLDRLRSVLNANLAMIDHLKKSTIERLLAKSKFE